MISKKYADLIICCQTVDSTMSEAVRIMSKLTPIPKRYIILADEQTAGFGRDGNTWIAPRGGLWVSYCFETESVKQQITLLLGLSLRGTLIALYPDLESQLLIKWPNDLIFEEKKLAGILVQSMQSYVIAGIGLNTNNPVPKLPSRYQPISLMEILNFEVSNHAIINKFLSIFVENYQSFLSIGLIGHRDKIHSCLYGMDKVIEFDTGTDVVMGRCGGLSEDGFLLIEDSQNHFKPHYAGSITNCCG